MRNVVGRGFEGWHMPWSSGHVHMDSLQLDGPLGQGSGRAADRNMYNMAHWQATAHIYMPYGRAWFGRVGHASARSAMHCQVASLELDRPGLKLMGAQAGCMRRHGQRKLARNCIMRKGEALGG